MRSVGDQKKDSLNFEPHYIILKLPEYTRVEKLEFKTEQEAVRWIKRQYKNIQVTFSRQDQFAYAKVTPMYTEEIRCMKS